MSYTFKSNGKVTASFMDREFEGNYEVDGNKVKITGLPGAGTAVMTLLEDGSIQGMGFKFTKQNGSRLDGTYANAIQHDSYTFKSNGEVTISLDSSLVAAYKGNYEVGGNKVKITAGNLNQVLTLLEDGSIQDHLGRRFVKQR
jgi:PKD repeat protein